MSTERCVHNKTKPHHNSRLRKKTFLYFSLFCTGEHKTPIAPLVKQHRHPSGEVNLLFKINQTCHVHKVGTVQYISASMTGVDTS